MTKKKINDVDLLLSKLDKRQLDDFIRKECANDSQMQARLIAFEADTLFKPDPDDYSSRVKDLIEDYGGRNGFINYRSSFDFNCAVTRILEKADEAMAKGRWEVAMSVLTGISSVSEDILNSGDDSAGELGAIVSECFETWRELCAKETLPDNIRSEIFELALSRFNDKNLKGWDWWWDWIQIAIDLADTSDKQSRVIKALDAIQPNGDDWGSMYAANTAQKYKLEMMSRCGSEDDQVRFMYDNVSNPDFREKLLQRAWNKGNFEEVLRLAKDGVDHDRDYAGLVSDWREWEYKVYRETGDKTNELQLARYFFFNGRLFGEKGFNMETMYSVVKSLTPKNEWPKYVETLISEAHSKRYSRHLLYIYTIEKMWQEYMDYLRKTPTAYNIDNAPKEVKKLFSDEIVKLYASATQNFFHIASDRKSYREGAELLRKLIKYGGKEEANQIVKEQKSRTPRRPALIDELSKL